ncbi:efflux RND transporter periplasmic adaptor subunit [Rhizobium paknamense]|uniref:RND family efflux transporter MFP subunit n=1 Tax=Rhizobium paknamense TaxID=1206817 RepID=A0ABU0I696_9HYPH|nr:HlyD family secretion protein [Rhizobium paknamense]MDQ0453747.1 RND family efflux transporter MFP subunit [Rhizobium paknamense]
MNTLKLIGRICLTLIVVAAAVLVGRHMWTYYMEEPWTRDGKIRADIVNIAPDVSGLVSDVMVRDNQQVHTGDILFRVDKRRFELALAQAEASLEQSKSSWDLAIRERERQERLGDSGSIQEREKAASTEEQAAAAYREAVATRDVAKLNLERADVRSTVNGTISNLSLQPGDYVAAGTAKVAVVNSDSLRAEGYFEENKLPRIKPGDRARIHLMGQKIVLDGVVDSIATGIEDRERSSSTGLLANITPTFNWVRLAQRVPVRIRLINVPQDVALIAGLTATVEVIGPDGEQLSSK